MTPNNHERETSLSTTSSSPDNIPHNHNCNFLPPLSGSLPLLSEIPERLLQDDASTRCPSYNEQDVLAGRQSSQEGICCPEEELALRQDPAWQEQMTCLRHERTQDQYEHASESSGVLFQGWSHTVACRDTRESMHNPRSWKHKLGTFAIIVLIIGSILLCAAVGTLSFLWFGGPDIQAWKEITARNWLSKAISICIGVIQQVMMLQLGIVTAALASLALESKDVFIGDVASVSVMRATAASTGVFLMAWQYLSHGPLRNARLSRIFALTVLAALLWCLSQFLLLIILTDVNLRSTAGLVSTMNLPCNLNYTNVESTPATSRSRWMPPSIGAWNKKISKYASFAEYSEPAYEADGVSDTGVTLRAFLPFNTAQERENLKSYKGKATVLDARVTCQVPRIENATLGPNGRFRGSLAPTRKTPRLTNFNLGDSSAENSEAMDMNLQPGWSGYFDCFIQRYLASPDELRITPMRWRFSLCQLWRGDPWFSDPDQNLGGLLSEFFDPSHPEEEASILAMPYLFLNNTGEPHPSLLSEDGIEYTSHERGEWLDLSYGNDGLIVSASICYAAFQFADLDVRISSKSNRTESRLEPVFDRDTTIFTFQELRHAMGQNRSVPLEKRGMLELEKGPWHPKTRVLDRMWLESTFVSHDRRLRLYANTIFEYHPH